MKIEISTFINRPSADVFAYISNFENNPKWQGGMVDAWFTSEPPMRVGTSYSQVAVFLGRRVESTFEVTEYQAGRLIKAKSIVSTFPITFTRIVDAENGGSRVTAIVEGDASGIFKLAEPLLAGKVNKSIHKDYENLKKILGN